jgi:hypothetical protein
MNSMIFKRLLSFEKPSNATVLLGEDSAFQADGVGSTPIGRSNASVYPLATNQWKG